MSEKDRIIVFTEDQIDYLFLQLSNTECNLNVSYKDVKDWDKAIHYQEQSILHAKQLKDGEDKIKKVYECMCNLASLYDDMNNLAEVKAVREEAYMYVNETYNPEHPLVLEAGGRLIEILNKTGNYYDAERFARICYESLTRVPLDPDSYEAAAAARNLAEASFNLFPESVDIDPESADIDEAEILARKAVRIVKELKGPGSDKMIPVFQTLIKILFEKKNFTDETKNLLTNFLSDAIRYQGVDGQNTGHANFNLGIFHQKITPSLSYNIEEWKDSLRLAESYFKEASRIFMKQYGPNHRNHLQITSSLSMISTALEQTDNLH
jgi:tetratricopeptide (TPR) repeat protein